jgi:hypothetical protein
MRGVLHTVWNHARICFGLVVINAHPIGLTVLIGLMI